jgi:soluble lytic murein transglycosylase-like protein
LKRDRGRVSQMLAIRSNRGRMRRNRMRPLAMRLGLGLLVTASTAYAADHVTLTNGFDLICDHQSAAAGRVRLYMDPGSSNFVEVDAAEIAASEHVDLPAPSTDQAAAKTPVDGRLTDAELHQLLAKAGRAHDVDVDLLASVVRQESGGNARAVSRAGAQGLMQLMPGTAAELGVGNAFAPGENIDGGTAYLDSLLRRYHDNLALALAAYNAGPAAVDRWHGIPPYRETRAYVARVIHEFNRRITARKNVQTRASITQLASAVR